MQHTRPHTLPVQQLQQQPPHKSALQLGWALPVNTAMTVHSAHQQHSLVRDLKKQMQRKWSIRVRPEVCIAVPQLQESNRLVASSRLGVRRMAFTTDYCITEVADLALARVLCSA